MKKHLIETSKWLARYLIIIHKKILKRVPACVSFALQLGVTFQQSLVLGNTSHYPVNPSLMIGDYVTPGNGISPQTYRQWSMAKSFCIEYSRKVKQLQNDPRHSNSSNTGDKGNNKQSRKLVFSSPASKLRLASSAVRILHAVDLTSLEPHFDHSGNNVAYLSKPTVNSVFGFGWGSGRNNSQWEARWRRLRVIPS